MSYRLSSCDGNWGTRNAGILLSASILAKCRNAAKISYFGMRELVRVKNWPLRGQLGVREQNSHTNFSPTCLTQCVRIYYFPVDQLPCFSVYITSFEPVICIFVISWLMHIWSLMTYAHLTSYKSGGCDHIYDMSCLHACGCLQLRMSGQNFGTPKCRTPARDIPANSCIAGVGAGARLAPDGSIPGRSSRKFRHISAHSFRIFRHISSFFSLQFRRGRNTLQ